MTIAPEQISAQTSRARVSFTEAQFLRATWPSAAQACLANARAAQQICVEQKEHVPPPRAASASSLPPPPDPVPAAPALVRAGPTLDRPLFRGGSTLAAQRWRSGD